MKKEDCLRLIELQDIITKTLQKCYKNITNPIDFLRKI